ncbi:MAG: multicopper oxidase domain-containing protein [Deltaproteobacteria bacterium]|nr:multicopper oxidase domain-containing protein [Deltaproteobacteria bacterium]
MIQTTQQGRRLFILLLGALLVLPAAPGRATVLGATGRTFTLTARADTISTGDGDSMWMWGLGLGGGRMQYPGPTLIVTEGDSITVILRNQLPVPVSLVFPGHSVTASGGTQGMLTREVPAARPGVPGQAVVYRFTATHPGTFSYHSGTLPDLEVEMGLVGALIVRPRGSPNQAYNDPASAFDREFLYLVTEADPVLHQQLAFSCLSAAGCDLASVDLTRRHPTDWFVNGRTFPDTMMDPFVAYLPTQPYNCAPMFHPGDRVLIRWVAGGADLHPFHTHGQNHLVIARDGRLLRTPGSAAPDLAVSDYTTTNVPGETVDALWGPWTGERLGWDVYGTQDINPHTCNAAPGSNFDPVSREYCPDHDKPLPVTLPSQSDVTYGVVGVGMWGGTPYLGVSGDVPPINPASSTQMNVVGGISFMWHSHAERELTTNNIFIGGMATMALIVPVGTAIP